MRTAVLFLSIACSVPVTAFSQDHGNGNDQGNHYGEYKKGQNAPEINGASAPSASVAAFSQDHGNGNDQGNHYGEYRNGHTAPEINGASPPSALFLLGGTLLLLRSRRS